MSSNGRPEPRRPACRRGRIGADRLDRGLRLVQRLPVRFHDHQAPLLQDRLVKLAARYSLSAYDAAYLELADRLRCPLRSLDDRLSAAAQSPALE